jgi:hypothetical protein
MFDYTVTHGRTSKKSTVSVRHTHTDTLAHDTRTTTTTMRKDDVQRWIDTYYDDARRALRGVCTLPPLTWSIAEHAHFASPRGYAVTWMTTAPEPASARFGLSRKMLSASPDRVLGLLRHEFGHVVDFAVNRQRRGAALDAWWAATNANANANANALPRTKERRADAIAYAIWSTPVYYDADDVQTIARHVGARVHAHPRPARLGL